MISLKNIGWLAGWLEGEGSFSLSKVRRGFLRMALQGTSTDRDVVARAARLMNTPVYGPYVYGTNKKPHYKIFAYHEAAAGWMMTLYSEMGMRRREQIRKCLAVWRNNQCSSKAKYS